MNSPKPNQNVDSLFRQALEPYGRARPSRNLWPHVAREIAEKEQPVWRAWMNRLLAFRLPPVRTWDTRIQWNSEFNWELQLLPDVNVLPRQILAMRLAP